MTCVIDVGPNPRWGGYRGSVGQLGDGVGGGGVHDGAGPGSTGPPVGEGLGGVVDVIQHVQEVGDFITTKTE